MGRGFSIHKPGVLPRGLDGSYIYGEFRIVAEGSRYAISNYHEAGSFISVDKAREYIDKNLKG